MPEEKQIVEQPHSCKIAINAKGQYSGEVKVYGITPELAYNEAIGKAEKLEQLIIAKNK